jgi:hypothetical protein
MKPIVASLFAAVLLVSSSALAAKGIVVSRDGQVLTGRIVELVNGDHLTIELANGQTQTLPWSEVFTVKLDDAPSAPAPVVAPPVANIYASPAPSLAKDEPSKPSPSSEEHFAVRPEIGMSAGLISMDGDLLEANRKSVGASELVGEGWAFRTDAGLRFSRTWTFYGSYEYDAFGKGSGASTGDFAPTGHAAAVGFKAVSNPRGPLAVFFDIGAGWRWLRFPGADNFLAVASGPEPLRIGLGGSIIVHPRFRIDVAANLAVGQLTRFALPNGSCVNPNVSECDSIPDSSRTWHVTRSFTLGGVFTL